MGFTITYPGLPVEETFDEVRQTLAHTPLMMLEAPPGAGKTTLIPLSLLNEPWLEGQKIIMLEPRRLAARMAAQRMADLLGEKVGQTVGYRIRQEKKVSAQTRIEVVTEGILTRQIQNDPALEGVGLVIFDEFHERNLQGDLGLAFCLDTQSALREDLRILLMSATLNTQELTQKLGSPPIVQSQGRAFDVALRHRPRPSSPFELPQACAEAIGAALREESGNILAFLPGEGEIRKTQALLQERTVLGDEIEINPLFGAQSQKDQDRAISLPASGKRKIVLATNIAETSLTIEGIRIVVDCGLKKRLRFDHSRGVSRLEIVRISQSSAIQRAGRAGRLEAGVCYRLWPEAETRAMAPSDPAEILESDLVPLCLEVAQWGAKGLDDLPLIDRPSENAFAQAQRLLQQFGALDENLSMSGHAKAMSRLPLHPRLSHMVIRAMDHGDAPLACLLASVLEEGGLNGKSREIDLMVDVQSLVEGRAKGAGAKRCLQTAKQLQSLLNITGKPSSLAETARLLARAFPDRIARLRAKGSNAYHLSNGMGAQLPPDHQLASEDFLVVADLGGSSSQSQIYRACAISQKEVEDVFAPEIMEVESVKWDKQSQSVQAERQRKLGALVLSRQKITQIDPELIATGLCEGIAQLGLNVLPWDKEATGFCQRIAFLRTAGDTTCDWPDFSQTGLVDHLEDWLKPYLNGVSKIDQLQKLKLHEILTSNLDWSVQKQLDTLAPTHFKVPSGSNIALDYSNPERPVLSVKLQEMFGCTQTPTLLNGLVALQIHLLSPARRPLQITEDLAGFWQNSYDSVKKEMKGRYPKHPWPDNPLEAPATGKTKRHLPPK